MSGEFSIAPAVFAELPNLRIAVAVAHGADNRRDRPAIVAEWRDAWQHAASVVAPFGNAQMHPAIKAWREAFGRMGVSGKQFHSSVEALARRALKGGQPFTINPLVDFYNAVSLRHLVPAGAFDLAAIQGHLELRLSRAGEPFTALDEREPADVAPGELTYASGATLLTRHLVWRQSRAGLVTPDTRDVILVSEVLRELGPDAAEAVRTDFERGLREHFDLTPRGWVLDPEHLATRW